MKWELRAPGDWIVCLWGVALVLGGAIPPHPQPFLDGLSMVIGIGLIIIAGWKVEE